MATKFPSFNQGLAQDPTTRRIWYGIATAHDFESHDGMTEEKLYQKLFSTHFGHLAIIALWVAGNLFHIAWQGNFEQFVLDPTHVRPIAHAIWVPSFWIWHHRSNDTSWSKRSSKHRLFRSLPLVVHNLE